jgi:signal transduction histidine kinase
MKTAQHTIDRGLLRIYRFFTAVVSLAYFLLLIVPGPIKDSEPLMRKAMLLFALTYGATFVYLMIPGLEELMSKFYLPVILIAASVIPIAITNAKYREMLAAGIPINTVDDTMTVTILLVFPLITTAWQYRFAVVFLFFVVLGLLDPILIVIANEQFTPEIYSSINASLVRILGLGAVGFMITELREQQRRERTALEDANRKLEEYALASERLSASRERNRIARDLHDTLAHTLSGLAIQLEAAATVIDNKNKPLCDMIERARQTVRVGLSETRRTLKAMRASPLDDLGLFLALEQLAKNITERDSISIKTAFPDHNPGWTESLEEIVYRIAQEALENMVRHADAGRCLLSLEGNLNFIRLTITDDGRGFEPSRISEEGRYGLKGMRERAAAAGGSLSVESRIGSGTTVRFTWEAANAGKD